MQNPKAENYFYYDLENNFSAVCVHSDQPHSRGPLTVPLHPGKVVDICLHKEL